MKVATENRSSWLNPVMLNSSIAWVIRFSVLFNYYCIPQFWPSLKSICRSEKPPCTHNLAPSPESQSRQAAVSFLSLSSSSNHCIGWVLQYEMRHIAADSALGSPGNVSVEPVERQRGARVWDGGGVQDRRAKMLCLSETSNQDQLRKRSHLYITL